MQSYWEILKEMVQMLLWIVIIVAVGVAFVSIFGWLFVWLLEVSPILGWCLPVVVGLFAVTTVLYFNQTDGN